MFGFQTITVVDPGEPTGRNGMGDKIYGAPILTVVHGCSVQEHHTSRKISDTDSVEARYKVFAPPGTPFVADGYVLMGAASSWEQNSPDNYVVDGEPAVWPAPNGSVDHIECYIKQLAG